MDGHSLEATDAEGARRIPVATSAPSSGRFPCLVAKSHARNANPVGPKPSPHTPATMALGVAALPLCVPIQSGRFRNGHRYTAPLHVCRHSNLNRRIHHGKFGVAQRAWPLALGSWPLALGSWPLAPCPLFMAAVLKWFYGFRAKRSFKSAPQLVTF